ncbi:MAG TPA: hypothetical protein DHN29_24575, partial [Cytophagales bacterium]|nr:hypothetical protein [Cytophagales bacterium]
MQEFNTRIAPSPTGDMHLGTARTAYFNWLAAKASGGQFHLRIDDTDTERSTEENIGTILDVMEWLGLYYDDAYQQSASLARYKAVANRLVNNFEAFEDDDCIRLSTLYEQPKGAVYPVLIKS